MSEPVWRQFGKGRAQHVLIERRVANVSLYGASMRPATLCNPIYWWNPGKIADRPDLPKCKRCLALLEKEKRT
jgi:hypothetical protein